MKHLIKTSTVVVFALAFASSSYAQQSQLPEMRSGAVAFRIRF